MGLPSRHIGIRTARLPKATSEVRWSTQLERLYREIEMTLRHSILRTSFNASLLLAVFLAILFHPFPVAAWEKEEAALPDFEEFSESVQHASQANLLRGVYVPGVLA